MVKIGNFFFHYRNFIFPIFYAALFIPSPQIFDNTFTAFWIGLLITAIGQGVRFLTIGLDYIIRGGKDRRVYAEDLVTTGIFAHSRNPMYVGNVLMLWGMGVLANNLLFLVIMGPFFLFIYQSIIRAEENFLENKFGPAFKDYCNDVNRWLPSLKGLGTTLGDSNFKWKRVILKEYNTTFYWTLAAVILLAKNSYETIPQEQFRKLDESFMAMGVTIVAVYVIIKILKKQKIMVSD